jgi:hypothetical protein
MRIRRLVAGLIVAVATLAGTAVPASARVIEGWECWTHDDYAEVWNESKHCFADEGSNILLNIENVSQLRSGNNWVKFYAEGANGYFEKTLCPWLERDIWEETNPLNGGQPFRVYAVDIYPPPGTCY